MKLVPKTLVFSLLTPLTPQLFQKYSSLLVKSWKNLIFDAFIIGHCREETHCFSSTQWGGVWSRKITQLASLGGGSLGDRLLPKKINLGSEWLWIRGYRTSGKMKIMRLSHHQRPRQSGSSCKRHKAFGGRATPLRTSTRRVPCIKGHTQSRCRSAKRQEKRGLYSRHGITKTSGAGAKIRGAWEKNKIKLRGMYEIPCCLTPKKNRTMKR